ncbi:MAG: InlB B-repeat-containing protein, partial [Oscillospiraceae bacterium]|nr:InlB B-repeat-containing protein [Oscillospiraceae bacterium]
VAKIEKGSEFKQNVISPTFIGFAPVIGITYNSVTGKYEGGTDASTIELAYDSVMEDITWEVYYKPIEVNFAVKYFFQNVNDDLYTENTTLYHVDKAETGTFISDEYLIDHAGDTTGFEKLYHIPDRVAADGSTVFECYYDRNYYLIKFNLNGGYGVDPIYARYGANFVVNNPIKPGYIFAGWDRLTVDTDSDGEPDRGDGVADVMPATIPAEKCFYGALWTTANTTYTVVYWKENADDNGYSYWGHEDFKAVSGSRVDGSDSITDDVAGNEKNYFEYNDARSDKNVLIEGDGSTVVNVYYTRKYYTIQFEAYGKCVIEENHTHTDSCYEIICGATEHIHDANCVKTLGCGLAEHTAHTNECLVCGKSVHTAHTDDCLICGKTEHTAHTNACITCGQTEHTVHTTSCYEGVGEKAYLQGSINGQKTEGYVYRGRISTYIFINESWYYYSGDTSSGNIAPRNCHTHTDACYKDELHSHSDGCYKDELHSHTDGCYKDELHSHSEECYKYSCGAIEHTHGNSCRRLICGMIENHKHTSDCNSKNEKNIVYILYAKYNQDIGAVWPTLDVLNKIDAVNKNSNGDAANANGNAFYGWDVPSASADVVSKRVNMTSDLCSTDNVATALYGGSYRVRLYYMFESFDQTSGPNSPTRKYYNGKYYDSSELYFQELNSNSSSFSQKQISGMTAVGRQSDNNKTNGAYNNYLYYDRERFQLNFQNISKTELSINAVMYDKPLQDIMYNGKSIKDYVPPYPETLEPNAYKFAGWYTSPGCFDGSEVIWNTIKMPEGNLLLYAKWAPVDHTVTFFTGYDEMQDYLNNKTTEYYEQITNITHGHVINASIEYPTKTVNGGGLIFAGWFYMENGEKKAFSILDTPIKKDMYIFADWNSSQPQPYRISYVLLGDEKVKVADDTIGFAYTGSTRTFTAKAGEPYNQLYNQFNKGFFPTVNSHSITMQYEEDKENPILNVYTFKYVEAEDIKYTVRYVDKEKNIELGSEIKSTKDAVVTERFQPFENMVPDAFYKRLVISVEWDEELKKYVGKAEDNVITFYYTKNETSAFYAVHFMLEKLGATEAEKQQYKTDGSGGYEETGTHIEGIGTVGNEVPITPQSFTGFKLITDQAIEKSNSVEKNIAYTDGVYKIEITDEGTELYIFYEREEYYYEVHHYIYNTNTLVNKEIAPSVREKATYGSTIEETCKYDIPGYTCVSAQKTQSITISDKEAQNVIIFYYAPIQYVVEYVAVPSEGGSLSTTIEVINDAEENFIGSVPTAEKNWKFVGWYTDQKCSVAVSDEGTINDETGEFIPFKNKMEENGKNIFYAKFELQAADFTIIKTNAADENQVFVYEVRSKTHENFVINVTIVGNGEATIKGLPLGDYTVTQLNKWSWRYSVEDITDAVQEVTHAGNPDSEGNLQGTTVYFSDTEAKYQWLNGLSTLVKNIYGKLTVKQGGNADDE